MKRLGRFFVAVAALLVTACSLFPSTPSPNEAIATQVAATLTAVAQPAAPTLSPEQVVAPSVAAPLTALGTPLSPPQNATTPQPTATATPLPVPWPVGFWVGNDASGTAVFYQWPGLTTTPPASLPPNSSVSVGSIGVVGAPTAPAFLYGDWGKHVFIYTASGQQTLGTLPQGSQGASLVSVLGAPSSLWAAYSYDLYGANYQIQSGLMVGKTDGQFTQAMNIDASDGYALLPLSFEWNAQSQPQALWVTTQIYGIGDVMVAPTRGLWRVDLATLQAVQVLPKETNGVENNILGVSPTGRWAAYWQQSDPAHVHIISPTQQGQPHTLNTLTNAASAATIGHGVFSADGRYVAWVEYVGSFDAGYHARIAVYDLTTDQPLALGNPLPLQIVAAPVAWLDAHTLLLSGWDGSNNVAVIWDVQAQSAPTIIHGSFLGVAY